MSTPHISGINIEDLAKAIEAGIDHAGNQIESFTDDKGGWPLRCCLDNSLAGEEIAIIAWSPFPWKGAYAETGPVVVHTKGCRSDQPSELPTEFDQRPMVLRPYGTDQRIAYHRVRHIEEGSSLTEEIAKIFEEDDVVFVHGRNVTGGCYAFTAERGL
jgi:hypothetical protein